MSVAKGMAGLVLGFALGCKSSPVALHGKLDRHVGGPFALATLQNKVVVVNFWATWCGPCKREIPDILAVMKDYEAKGVVLLAVDQDDGEQNHEVVEEFLLTHPVAGLKPYIVYPDETFMKTFEVTGLPTTYVLDAQGKTLAKFLGGVSAPVLRSNLDAALKSVKPKV